MKPTISCLFHLIFIHFLHRLIRRRPRWSLQPPQTQAINLGAKSFRECISLSLNPRLTSWRNRCFHTKQTRIHIRLHKSNYLVDTPIHGEEVTYTAFATCCCSAKRPNYTLTQREPSNSNLEMPSNSPTDYLAETPYETGEESMDIDAVPSNSHHHG